MRVPIDAADGISGMVETVLGTPTAADVFGPATIVGDTVVIPAAAFERAGGFGFGAGEGGDETEGGGGLGGGGGGTIEGRPVAVIEVGPGGVRVHSILDTTRITVAVIATLLALRRLTRKRA
jgi:uncharacterized spore protein YtfJ